MGEGQRAFSITVPKSVYARVKKLAKAQQRRVGPQIRVMLERYLPELEREVVEAGK